MMGLQIAFWCSEFQYYDNRGSGDTTDGGAALQKRRQMDKGVFCVVLRDQPLVQEYLAGKLSVSTPPNFLAAPS